MKEESDTMTLEPVTWSFVRDPVRGRLERVIRPAAGPVRAAVSIYSRSPGTTRLP